MQYDEEHLNEVLRYSRKSPSNFKDYEEGLEQLDDDDASRIIKALELLDMIEEQLKDV